MLYELSSCEVIALKDACAVAKVRMAENAESYERRANNQRFSAAARASANWVAKWYQERAAAFEAVSKALGVGRGITTLAQAKEALERCGFC